MGTPEISKTKKETPLPEWAGDLLSSLPPMMERVEAASLSRLSMKTLDRAIASKALEVVRMGDRVLVPRAGLVAWLAASGGAAATRKGRASDGV
jgi:excisionase family DNA binding protein